MTTGWPDMSPLHEAAYDKFVPDSGDADTEFGQILRHGNNLIYRFYNDGDVAVYGGNEYVDTALEFLVHCSDSDIADIAREMCVLTERDAYVTDENDCILNLDVERRYDELCNDLCDALNDLCEVEMSFEDSNQNKKASKKASFKKGKIFSRRKK